MQASLPAGHHNGHWGDLLRDDPQKGRDRVVGFQCLQLLGQSDNHDGDGDWEDHGRVEADDLPKHGREVGLDLDPVPARGVEIYLHLGIAVKPVEGRS